jgi:hypothetical protein
VRVTLLTAYIDVCNTRKGSNSLRTCSRCVFAADEVVVLALSAVGWAAVGEACSKLWAIGVFDTRYCGCRGYADAG